jgi:Hemolysins and related proteins containing CBS domains
MDVVVQSSLLIPTIAFVISLILCALFSFLETSITALRLFTLKEIARKSNPRYKYFFQTLENAPQRVLGTILIANSLANVTSAALITNVMENLFARIHLSSGLGFSIGIGVATTAILIFGEILPKNIAKTYSDRYFKSTLWISNITFRLFEPVAAFLTRLSDFILHKMVRPGEADTAEWVSEKEIQFLIDHIGQKGLMETEKTEMLRNIFELGHTPIKEIMVPANDIISVDVSTSIKEVLNIFAKHHYTRLPVYKDTVDNVIGIVHLKDIFLMPAALQERPLKDILRPILFVPETLKVNQLLRELRQQNVHMAIVLNEHGIVTGLITLENVLEEIVGEISDEHEMAVEKYIELKQGGWLMNGNMPIEDVAELIGIEFETESAMTLGGFLTEQLQHVPKKGERILYKDYYFQVQDASPKRVLRVLVFNEKTEL